jgi:hypothetical protein
MNIKHHPYMDPDKACAVYSKKDGVPIKYVCTTGYGHEAMARDVFFRDTPHPEFGNRYFHLFWDNGNLYIGNADRIESEVFDMILGEEGWEYSQHRHDYRTVGANSIDGGRAYRRVGWQSGSVPVAVEMMVVRDGEFVTLEDNA